MARDVASPGGTPKNAQGLTSPGHRISNSQLENSVEFGVELEEIVKVGIAVAVQIAIANGHPQDTVADLEHGVGRVVLIPAFEVAVAVEVPAPRQGDMERIARLDVDLLEREFAVCRDDRRERVRHRGLGPHAPELDEDSGSEWGPASCESSGGAGVDRTIQGEPCRMADGRNLRTKCRSRRERRNDDEQEAARDAQASDPPRKT